MGDGDPEPALPLREAAATAQWTREVLEGKVPVPAAIARQVALIAGHCRERTTGRAKLKLVSSR
jgi:hypothetical protein